MPIVANDIEQIEIGWHHKEELFDLLNTSSYEDRDRSIIHSCIAFLETIEKYEFLKANLLQNQVGIDGAVNPGQREINSHLRKFCKK